MTEPYRPSNGTESAIFMARFCEQCARDSEDKPCQIIAKTLFLDIDHPDYPEEWIKTSEFAKPKCTAFIPEGEPIPEERCKNTIEMF